MLSLLTQKQINVGTQYHFFLRPVVTAFDIQRWYMQIWAKTLTQLVVHMKLQIQLLKLLGMLLPKGSMTKPFPLDYDTSKESP